MPFKKISCQQNCVSYYFWQFCCCNAYFSFLILVSLLFLLLLHSHFVRIFHYDVHQRGDSALLLSIQLKMVAVALALIVGGAAVDISSKVRGLYWLWFVHLHFLWSFFQFVSVFLLLVYFHQIEIDARQAVDNIILSVRTAHRLSCSAYNWIWQLWQWRCWRGAAIWILSMGWVNRFTELQWWFFGVCLRYFLVKYFYAW